MVYFGNLVLASLASCVLDLFKAMETKRQNLVALAAYQDQAQAVALLHQRSSQIQIQQHHRLDESPEKVTI